MRARRRFVNGELYFVTCRTSRGLPFVANEPISLVINGAIARAQEIYAGVTICAFLFMGNHYHFVVVLDGDADDMRNFFGYLNGEIARMFNRLEGITHRKFWSSRYKVSPILTAEDALEKICYTYLNPGNADLIDRISDWEGASSYGAFVSGQSESYRWIRSSSLLALPRGPFSKNLRDGLLQSFESKKGFKKKLEIKPFAWKKCFPETKNIKDGELHDLLVKMIGEGEQENRDRRLREGKRVLGLARLREQSIYKKFFPKTRRNSPLCICKCRELRAEYRKIHRAFSEQCRQIWILCLRGIFSASLPSGAFIPSRPPTSNILRI